MFDQVTLSKFLPWALLGAAAAALGTAYTAEFGYGYEPCQLCLYQRVPFGVIAVLGIVALFITSPLWRARIALAAGCVFLTGMAIAFYHVGVEQTWWVSATACGASGPSVTTTEDLFAQLQTKAPKSCGDIDWTFLGISMATYNVGFQLLLAIGAFHVWRRLMGDG